MKELPPELYQEVEDFVQFLIEKHGRPLRQDWGGALKDYRDRYTSLEFQHKISEWRIGEK